MRTFKDLEFSPHLNGAGLMARMDFSNGYGISVVRFKLFGSSFGSYTDNDEEWECAILKNGSLCYDTPITDDVIGHLKENDVTDLMEKIQNLKSD